MKCQKCYHDNLPGAYLCTRCGQQLGDRQTLITCAFRGSACTNPGTLSPSTTGNGPWYCSEHAGTELQAESEFLHDRAEPRILADRWQALKATLQAIIRRRQPGED